MSAQIITLMKYGLLALMYLYFARVMHTVWVELRPTGKLRAPEAKKSRADHNRDSRQNPRAAVAAQGSTGEHHHTPSKTPAPRRQSNNSGRGGGSGSTLVVVEPANLSGMSYPLSGKELTIGRAPGCGVTVDDSFVSSLHARLARANNQTVVEDLGSRNGTYVNDNRIGQPTVVNPGDRVRVGSVIMELR